MLVFQPIDHVSVSPTDGIRPTQGQRKTLTRVGIEPTTLGLIAAAPPTELVVRREQVMGNEDVNDTAMNM